MRLDRFRRLISKEELASSIIPPSSDLVNGWKSPNGIQNLSIATTPWISSKIFSWMTVIYATIVAHLHAIAEAFAKRYPL